MLCNAIHGGKLSVTFKRAQGMVGECHSIGTPAAIAAASRVSRTQTERVLRCFFAAIAYARFWTGSSLTCRCLSSSDSEGSAVVGGVFGIAEIYREHTIGTRCQDNWNNAGPFCVDSVLELCHSSAQHGVTLSDSMGGFRAAILRSIHKPVFFARTVSRAGTLAFLFGVL